MSVLHVFDMDGTLLVGSACLEISRAYGVYAETLEIEETWARGEIADHMFWERCLPLWAGLGDEDIERAFAGAQWLERVRDVFSDIRERGEFSVVITQSPQFFVDRLQRWGATHAHGALVKPGDAAGAGRMVTRDDKLAVARGLLTRYGLEESACVVFGDSSSDLTLFEQLANTVGVNPREHIRRLARVTYEGNDLWEAYGAGRALLAAQTGNKEAL